MWVLTVRAFPVAAQEDLPAGKGKVTLESTCTECHGLDQALTRLRTERQWRDIATRMRSKGATMTDDELNTLVEYLSLNFGSVETEETKARGKGETGQAVNINKAAAREIEAALKLRAADAAAIVRYREANGPFKEWRDLIKVEGIDTARLGRAKDRIRFQ